MCRAGRGAGSGSGVRLVLRGGSRPREEVGTAGKAARGRLLANIFHLCYMTLMSLKHAILGFLDVEPTTGYTLLQRFEGSVGSFWTATQSQIYRELHALEADGLVRVQVVPQDGKPAKKVYRPTRAGVDMLRAWLSAPVEPTQLRDPLLLKLVFAAEVPPRTLDAVLKGYQDTLAATQQEYAQRLKSTEIFSLARSARERVLWELSIQNGLMWAEAQLAWVKKARAALTAARKR